MSIIYGLLDDDATVRYVGATKFELDIRIKQHWRSRMNNDYPLKRWLQSRSTPPYGIILETCENNRKIMISLEYKWITHYGIENLTNIYLAGDMCASNDVDPAVETQRIQILNLSRSKIAAKNTGQKRSPEQRQRQRDAKYRYLARVAAQGGFPLMMCECGAGPFAGLIGLGVHVKAIHIGMNIVKEQSSCQDCDRIFSSARALKIHRTKTAKGLGDRCARS